MMMICGKMGHIAKKCFHKVKTAAIMPTVQCRPRRDDQRRNIVDKNVSDKQTDGSREVEQNRAMHCKLHGRSYCQKCVRLCHPHKAHM